MQVSRIPVFKALSNQFILVFSVFFSLRKDSPQQEDDELPVTISDTSGESLV
jgi:hypothetical protein